MKIWKFKKGDIWESLGDFEKDEDWVWSHFKVQETPLILLGDEINSFGVYECESKSYFVACEIEELKQYVLVDDFPSLFDFLKIASEIIRAISYTNQIICDIDD